MSNKTSDKNVGNIEDGIKFLKSKEAEQLYFRGNPKLKNIFDNILAELEQRTSEYKSWKRKNKDIKLHLINK